MLISKRGTIQELPSQFEEEVQFLAGHLFRADWQLEAVQGSTDNGALSRPLSVHGARFC
jgi:hypothetical protein